MMYLSAALQVVPGGSGNEMAKIPFQVEADNDVLMVHSASASRSFPECVKSSGDPP